MIRQLLTESLLLALCGGLVGIAVAYGGIQLFKALLPPDLAALVVPFFGIEMSPQVVVFTVLLSAVTAVVFGAWPALKASRPNIAQLLKEEGSRSPKGAGLSGRGFLVALELVLAVVLLVSAGLLIRSFLSLQGSNPSFEAARMLTAALEVQEQTYTTPESRRAVMQTLQSELAALPAVEGVGAVSILPFELRNQGTGLLVQGQTGGVEEGPGASYLTAMPGYFRTMGIRLLRGTGFGSEHGADTAPVVVINQALAERIWPGQDPIGKELILTRLDPVPRRVIGVSEDVRYGRLGGPMPSVVYVPLEQDPRADMVFVLRTATDPRTLMAAVRERVWQVDDTLPVRLRAMETVLNESVSQALVPVPPLTIFAGIALVLAAVGIFGVASFAVNQRRHEIGVRMALGARRGDILRMLVMQAVKLTAVGLVVGLLCALGISRILAGVLYGVSATDPVVFILVPLLLLAVALLSSYLPALRAAKINPVAALRQS
jgi:predicted permease